MRRYDTVAAFESALRSRLLVLATPERTFQDLRRQVAFDRVLARLQRVAPGGWLLKGGVALEYRLTKARSTLGIDISTTLDLDGVGELLARASDADLDDYFQMTVGERISPAGEVATYRFHIALQYADGRTFENLKLDVGLDDPWIGIPAELEASHLLDFAGIAPATIRAIPVEQHLAEKLHAYTKRYGSGSSTRVKDLVDIILLVDADIDRDALQGTLRTVFESRNTHELPDILPTPPVDWRIPYQKPAANLPVPPTLTEGHRHAALSLSALLSAK